MAHAEDFNADGALRLSVLCGGAAQEDLALVSLRIRHALNEHSWAELVLIDDGMATGDFALSDSALFEPGADIQLRAGYGDSEDEIFSGTVLRQGFRSGSNGDGRLIVSCRGSNGGDGTAGQRSLETLPEAALMLTWGQDMIDFEADTLEPGAWIGLAKQDARLARVSGRTSFFGSAAARPGAVIELAGVGRRFSGPVLLDAVVHEIGDGRWISRVEFGGGPSSDHGEPLVIKDRRGNRIELSEAGIALHSRTNISLAATIGITATGFASAELSSSGLVTVKGAMVITD